MKKIVIILIVLALFGCSSKEENKYNLKTSNDYKEIMQEKDYLIIDVRTKEEYSESHVKGAINIPYDEINKDSDIPKDKTIFVYCKSGARSKIAYTTLKELNFEVYDLGAFNSIDLEKE